MHAAAANLMGPLRLYRTAPPIASTAASRVDPDRAEVDAAARGEVRAFEALYRRHSARIHGVLRRLAGNDTARAEELTPADFVRLGHQVSGARGTPNAPSRR